MSFGHYALNVARLPFRHFGKYGVEAESCPQPHVDYSISNGRLLQE
jgi:hypothetical protein